MCTYCMCYKQHSALLVVRCHISISVQPEIVTLLESITLPQGDSQTFVCAAVADPRAVFVFRFDGERITSNSSKHTLVTNSTHGTLTVSNLQGSDEGIYTCSASNRYGSVSTAAVLSVQGGLGGASAYMCNSPFLGKEYFLCLLVVLIFLAYSSPNNQPFSFCCS